MTVSESLTPTFYLDFAINYSLFSIVDESLVSQYKVKVQKEQQVAKECK